MDKIEIIDNYFVYTKTSGETANFHKSQVRIEDVGDVVYFIFDNLKQKYPFKYDEVTKGDGSSFLSKQDLLDWGYRNTGATSTTVTSSETDMSFDVWGIPKVSIDKSIFSGLFSFNVPAGIWYETINDVTVYNTFTNCDSVNGELTIDAGATLNDTTHLRSFRNPRYEPNRGHKYSIAGFLDNPSATMNRCFGLGTSENAVYFKLESGVLKGVVRTTINTVTTESEVILDTTGIDLSKGNLYDFRFQWRGVGDYFFYINQKVVGGLNNLGTLDNLSMANPALPAFFESENLGDNDSMRFGCLDVTSENGEDQDKTFGSISIDNQVGQVAISGFNVPVLVVRVKPTYDGKINTRDIQGMVLSAYSDQRSYVRVYYTRDETAITLNDQAWRDYGDGNMEFIQYDNPDVTTPITFDTAKAELIYGNRVAQDIPFEAKALFEGETKVYQTPGDIFIFAMHRESGGAANVGVTYQFAEQI